MSKTIFTAFITILILVSCSSNSDDNNNNLNNLPNVTVLSTNSDYKIIQQDILNNGENIVTTNLTEQIGVPYDYHHLNYHNEILSFFDRVIDNYSVYEKNLNNGNTTVVQSICNPITQAVQAADRSENKFILFTVDVIPDQNHLYILDKLTNECLQVDIGIGQLYSDIKGTLVDNEILYVYLIKEVNQANILRIDLNTGEITNELVLGSNPKVTLIGDLLYSQSFDGAYTAYNKQTFELVSISNVQTQLIFGGIGISRSDNNGNNIPLKYILPQPSLFESSPAIIDISTVEIVKGGPQLIFDLKDNLIAEIGTDVTFGIYYIDVHSECIIIAYEDLLSGNANLLFSNFNAEILKIVALNSMPRHIFIH